MRPTLWPSFARASARFTATVVLPTPPLPLATAMRFFTPGIGWRSGICCGAGPGGIVAPESVAQAFRPEDSLAIGLKIVWTSPLRGEPQPLCIHAVALFIFLSRAAGARVVAADFRAGADRLRRFSLRSAGLKLQIL